VGAFIATSLDFNVLWRYFSWSNQTLAMIALWAASVYLFRRKRNYWITVVPASFMSAVSCTYILMAQEGFKLPTSVAYPVGIAFAAACLGVFLWSCVMGKGKNANTPVQETPYESAQ
jgi:carbon starvation protein CstA